MIRAYCLENTCELMTSENYRERFVAEYIQTKVRYEKLKSYNAKIEAAAISGADEPEHDCPAFLLREQQRIMGEYLHLLEVRAHIEGIELLVA